MRLLSALILTVAVGCAHSHRPASPTPLERRLAERLEAIAYQGGAPAVVDGIRLQRTVGGAIRATGPASRVVADDRARDLRIEAAIRGRLSTDPLLAGQPLDVDVDQGVARISGDLQTREQAARLVLVALSTEGVRFVESRVTWVPERERRLLVGRASRVR